MKTNLKLTVAAVLLLAASIWTYADSVSRGNRFERGRKLLPNLAIDEVAKIVVTASGETTTLERDQEGFTLAEVHDYPARNESVNRLLRDLLEIGLEKEIGSGADLAAELEIDPPADDTVDLRLENEAGEPMVHLRLGKTLEGGDGRYVKRMDHEDEPIYLTTSAVYLQTSRDSLLQKEIVDYPASRVVRVEGSDFVLAPTADGAVPTLANLPGGRKERTAETARVRGVLDRLGFDQVYLADDPEVSDLSFERRLRVSLDDDTSYTLSLAQKDGRSFLQIRGDHSIGQVMITLDTPKEELKEKADQLTRAEEIGKFNEFHDSWIYAISSGTASKLELAKKDLME